MVYARLFAFCVLGLTFPCCRERADSVEKELKEAGYSMKPEAWFSAVRANDPIALEKMRAGGFDLNSKDDLGHTALHAAATSGHTAVAEYLLKSGLAINSKGGGGRTPLMSAVLAKQSSMAQWLLNQGADHKLKDDASFTAMMLAVTDGGKACIEELAPYYRDELDSALLLAALKGKAAEIDALTNFGASVYTQMEDGRTPLMLAAQNGHREAVQMLIDIGASRFTKTEHGETAFTMAVAAGHTDLAHIIERGFVGNLLALDTDEKVTEDLENELNEEFLKETIDATKMYDSVVKNTDLLLDNTFRTAKLSTLEGAEISAIAQPKNKVPTFIQPPNGAPSLIMRSFRQRELPVDIKQVTTATARLRISGASPSDIELRAGQMIPGSKISIVRIFNKVEMGKLNDGNPIEYQVVEVFDHSSGRTSEWAEGRPAVGHEALAMVEDAVSGRRYIAKSGQRFTSVDGREFIVIDVRPSQIVIEEVSSGEVNTLRLRGSKG